VLIFIEKMEEALLYWCDSNLDYKITDENLQMEEYKTLTNKNNPFFVDNIKDYLYCGRINNEILYYIFRFKDGFYNIQYIIKYRGFIFYNNVKCKNMVDIIYAFMRFDYYIVNNMMKNMHRFIYRVSNSTITPDLIFENSLDHYKDKVVKYLLNHKEINNIIGQYGDDIITMNTYLDLYN